MMKYNLVKKIVLPYECDTTYDLQKEDIPNVEMRLLCMFQYKEDNDQNFNTIVIVEYHLEERLLLRLGAILIFAKKDWKTELANMEESSLRLFSKPYVGLSVDYLRGTLDAKTAGTKYEELSIPFMDINEYADYIVVRNLETKG